MAADSGNDDKMWLDKWTSERGGESRQDCRVNALRVLKAITKFVIS